MLIGHKKQKAYFEHVIDNGSLNHAYLFAGSDMIGKKTFALDIYRLINGRESYNDPDFKLVAPKTSKDEYKIYIEDIRLLKAFFSLKPYHGPYKLAVIDNAHCLTIEATNALLKILEEPPSFSVIILISSVPDLLPLTIASRCEEVRFLPASKSEVSDYFVAKKVSSEDKEFLTTLASGRIGFINKLLESKNLINAKKAIIDLRQILRKGIFDKMNYAKELCERDEYSTAVDYWLYWVSAHVKNDLKNRIIVKKLLQLSDNLNQPQFNHRLALENFLINL